MTKKASRNAVGLLFHSYANRFCRLFYWVMFFLVFDDDYRYQMDIWSRRDNSNLILGWLWRFEHCVIKVQK